MYMFLDLTVNRAALGFGAIFIGVIFSSFNYTTNNKKQRQVIIIISSCITCTACLALPLYLATNLRRCFHLHYGWAIIGGGIIAGLILSFVTCKMQTRLFSLSIGSLTGFCLANSLEICILYQAKYSFYLEYIISMGGFWFLAIVFHYNVFNTMVSFCGSFFLVRGAVIILFNS